MRGGQENRPLVPKYLNRGVLMKNNRLLIAFACVLVIGLVLIVFIWSVVPRQYVTTDLADYGNYVGNYDNQSVQKFITSFFPKEIQENFFMY